MEPDKLYVEVAGTNVQGGHELVLEKNGEPVSTLAMTQKQWHQRYECDYAVDGAERFDHTLTLTVEKEQGGHLRLPLLDEPRPTRLAARTQPNLLFPIYPLARLPSAGSESGHALLRPGYLYVFWKGILWRELETDASGKLRDVDLVHWREQAKQVTPPEDREQLDNRPAVGIPLETLWVPARFQQVGGAKWTVGDVELAWSEQPWSWDYIESLESGGSIIELPGDYREWTGIPSYGKPRGKEQAATTRRSARCIDLSQLRFYEHRKRFGPDAMGSRDWLPAHSLAVSRQRNVAREMDATDPCRVTQALDGRGQEPDNSVMHEIRDELERLEGYTCKAEETTAFAKGLTNWVDGLVGEGWQEQFGGDRPDTTQEPATDKSEAARRDLLDAVRSRLASAPAEADQLAPLRQRHIPAVLVPDVLFDLAWLTSQHSLHLTHLQVVAESTQQHPHFKSAMLLHSAMFDHRAYQRSPFDDYRHAVDMAKLDEALRKDDRAACRSTCYELLNRRISLLEGSAVPVFNDLFALNGLRYPIALMTLNPLLTHLDNSVFQFDPLAGQVEREREAYRDQAGSGFITKLANGQTELAWFLTVDPGQAPLDQALADTAEGQTFEVEPNDGSGRLRPGLIQHLQSRQVKKEELPEALREHYELSGRERQAIVDNIALMADPDLLRWAQVSYTTLGQLMADLTSELYLTTQRVLLGNLKNTPIYQVSDTLQVPTRLMKLGNPFMRGLVLTHANPMLQNPNPDMVPLGIRFGSQATGIGRLSNEALQDALAASNGAAIVRPKGGVINRVGPDMSGNYAVIRNGNGRMVANATSVAGIQGSTATVAVRAEMFLAHKDSVAARMSKGFTHSQGAATVLMRWAPPGMLGVFGWNVVSAVQGIYQAALTGQLGAVTKGGFSVLYGTANLMYWLGHIVEAENLARETRLSWLTKPRVEVDEIRNQRLKSAARWLFTDRVLSIAKFAGVFGAALEVLLSLWNGVERLAVRDVDAALGYFAAGSGFLVFMFAHRAGTALIPLLGISFAAALALVSLVVALAALFWAIARTDDTLETWLKHGPFGKDEPADQFRHLHEAPEDAFLFLVGALFPLTGNSNSLSWFNDRGLLSGEEEDWLFDNERNEGHIIAIRSAAFALVDRPEEQFEARFWKSWRQGRKVKPVTPEFIHYDAERQMLRFHFAKPEWRGFGRSRYLERLKAKVQLVMGNGGVLPVSGMDQPLLEPVAEPEFSSDTPRWFRITS